MCALEFITFLLGAFLSKCQVEIIARFDSSSFSKHPVSSLPFFSNVYFYLFIWLHQVLVAARRIFIAVYKIKFPDQGLDSGPLHWSSKSYHQGSPLRLLLFSM